MFRRAALQGKPIKVISLLTHLTDRQKRFTHTLTQTFPDASHEFFMRHPTENCQRKFKDQIVRNYYSSYIHPISGRSG